MSSKRVFGRFISIAVCVHIKIYTGLSAPLSVVCAGLSCSYDNTKKIDEVKTINAFGMWTNTKNFFCLKCDNTKKLKKNRSCNKNLNLLPEYSGFVQVTCRYRLRLSLSAVASADFVFF